MKWKNDSSLPQPVVDAITNDSYTRGKCDYTVSELLRPPRIHILTELHKEEIEEDVIDHLWRVIGQSVHVMLERANNTGIAERRLYAEIGGKLIGGGMDYYHSDGILLDYKITNTFKVKLKDFSDYESQLNIYRYILHKNGEEVKEMQIVAILRDWIKSGARRDPNYPQKQIAIIPIRLWNLDFAERFIVGKIKGLEEAKKSLPFCTADDRWSNPRSFGVRCSDYCSVSRFCSQYQESKKEIA